MAVSLRRANVPQGGGKLEHFGHLVPSVWSNGQQEQTDSTAERFDEAELYRLHGEALLAASGEPATATRSLRNAVAVVTRQGASLFALRAAVKLSKPGDGADGHRAPLVAARGSLPSDARVSEAVEADALLARATTQ